MELRIEDEIRIFTSLKSVLGEPASKPIVVVCGWCPDKDAKTKKALDAGFRVSHGMCPDCTERELPTEGKE